jgi:tetratricopeptide (TPR) repeat protein
MAGRLVDVDPEAAYKHAVAARNRAGRISLVREAAGIVGYLAGEYGEALKDLRAYRRMTGSGEHLPLMADCERGLGRPQKALDLAADPMLAEQPAAVRAEMRIVAAGARRDLGQPEAALVTLQGNELASGPRAPWWCRLAYAYGDTLLELGRHDEALDWLRRAAVADPDGSSGAADLLGELEGVTFTDVLDDSDITPESPTID